MSKPCIYCGRLFDNTRGEGDHVLAAALFGEFEGAPTFRGVCLPCNHEFGKREQMLAQSSQIGFFRWLLRPKRRRRPDGSLVQRGAGGARPPVFKALSGPVPMLVRPAPEDPATAGPIDQIVIRDHNGDFYQIPWFRGMSDERIKREIAKRQVNGVEAVWFECDAIFTDDMKATLASVFPELTIVGGAVREPGTIAIHQRAEFEVSTWYFQALAKIAFHYFLLHSFRRFEGSEPLFQPIRDFIRFGGDKEQFFHSSGCTIVPPFGETEGGLFAPPNWCHLLVTHELERANVVFMQFFVGPIHVPPPVYVTLGNTGSDIILPMSVGLSGHTFLYEFDRDDDLAGRMKELSFHRIR